MLEWLFLVGLGVTSELLNQESEETKEKRTEIYSYYNDYIEYYLDNAKAEIADRAYEDRKHYGSWPNVKNSHYVKKDIEKPECVEDAVDLEYIDDYYNAKKYLENLKRKINYNWISYENRSDFEEVIKDFDDLDKFENEEELEY